MNCANCAIAVDSTFAGKPASALPWTYQKVIKNGKLINIISYRKGTHISVLEKEFGKKIHRRSYSRFCQKNIKTKPTRNHICL
ncbi:toxin glutamine deamidase domain-containing protein [Flavobacterium lindanitolerans]|uniref:toxin glutamine deamidase domain-containing protein n=1 Tax=Flavobacterium lindanitolerans TaxID=428988 RepID=UPI003B5C24CB